LTFFLQAADRMSKIEDTFSGIARKKEEGHENEEPPEKSFIKMAEQGLHPFNS
jgi:hypothetical protein